MYYESEKIKEIEEIIERSNFNEYLLKFDVMKKLPFKHNIMIFLYKIRCLKMVVGVLNFFGFKIY